MCPCMCEMIVPLLVVCMAMHELNILELINLNKSAKFLVLEFFFRAAVFFIFFISFISPLL